MFFPFPLCFPFWPSTSSLFLSPALFASLCGSSEFSPPLAMHHKPPAFADTASAGREPAAKEGANETEIGR